MGGTHAVEHGQVGPHEGDGLVAADRDATGLRLDPTSLLVAVDAAAPPVAGGVMAIPAGGGNGHARSAAPSGAGESVRITEACTACGACLVTCPEHALRRAPKRPIVLDAACTACWACIEICPAGAIVEVG